MAHYLTTFRPLCSTAAGKKTARKFGHPPYIDGSCRREPDFESQFPSITAICHSDKFAPRLLKGDRVAFLTVKLVYPGHEEPRWRLVAGLEVVERFDAHAAAAEWYRAKGLRPPSNCMVRGSEPLGLEHTAHPNRDLREWDLGYWARARQVGTFLACKALHLEVCAPTAVTEEDLAAIFGKVPSTQTPPAITKDQYDKLMVLAAK